MQLIKRSIFKGTQIEIDALGRNKSLIIVFEA